MCACVCICVCECMPYMHMPMEARTLSDPLQLELEALVSAGDWTKSCPLGESVHAQLLNRLFNPQSHF